MCLLNASTMRGQSKEVVKLVFRRKVDICGLHEMRWRAASVRLVKGEDSRYEMTRTWVVLEFYWQKSEWRQCFTLSVFQIELCLSNSL